MKLIVAGGRDFEDYDLAKKTIQHYLQNTKYEDVEIVSGACSTGTVTYTRPDGTKVCGADGLGEKFATEFNIKPKYFPAEWKKHPGKRAAYVRNAAMANYSTHCICFWDGNSPGTKLMADLAQEARLPTKVILYRKLVNHESKRR